MTKPNDSDFDTPYTNEEVERFSIEVGTIEVETLLPITLNGNEIVATITINGDRFTPEGLKTFVAKLMSIVQKGYKPQ
jgi:hypothetical protein